MEDMVISSESENTFVPEKVKKAVILLHGFGSCGSDIFCLVPFLADALPDVAFFCPDAKQELPPEIEQIGFEDADEKPYQWFSLLQALDVVSMGQTEEFKKLAGNLSEKAVPAYKALTDYAEKIKSSYGLKDSDIAFAGFSQGAEVAIGAAFSQSSPVAAVVGFSPLITYFCTNKAACNPPVILTHGDDDSVIPSSIYNVMLESMREKNVKYENVTTKNCGHFIDSKSLSAVADFLRSNLFKEENR